MPSNPFRIDYELESASSTARLTARVDPIAAKQNKAAFKNGPVKAVPLHPAAPKDKELVQGNSPRIVSEQMLTESQISIDQEDQ